MIDYREWSREYYEEAQKILNVIKRKQEQLKAATKDEQKTLNEQIIGYRMIYYDLLKSAETLSERARSGDPHAS